jgi:hypothetical protein
VLPLVRFGLAILCPITSHVKGYPFEAALPAGSAISGPVLSDQVKSLDRRARRADLIETLPPRVTEAVLQKLETLLGRRTGPSIRREIKGSSRSDRETPDALRRGDFEETPVQGRQGDAVPFRQLQVVGIVRRKMEPFRQRAGLLEDPPPIHGIHDDGQGQEEAEEAGG